jgi:hypothetical protein
MPCEVLVSALVLLLVCTIDPAHVAELQARGGGKEPGDITGAPGAPADLPRSGAHGEKEGDAAGRASDIIRPGYRWGRLQHLPPSSSSPCAPALVRGARDVARFLASHRL